MKTRIAVGLALAILALSRPSFAGDSSSSLEAANSPDSAGGGDFNREIYYRNKLELSFDTGYLPFNTPLILGPILGDRFQREAHLPNYIIVPLMLSLRWHLYDIKGRSFWRGNTELGLSGSYNVIVHGPESYYASLGSGVRYNFVQPNWRVVPYTELRIGLGFTDAAQPYQVAHHEWPNGQGQDFTFTFIFGSGVRYNFSPRYSMAAGLEYMHISNAYLSEPQYYNHGVNVVGPRLEFNVAL
ncbi:MAG: acyloxyacyl hydrolase [Candidatus Binatales bacterium]